MLEIRKREDAAAVFSMPLPASAAGPGAIWRMGGGGGRAREDKRGQGSGGGQPLGGPSSSTFYPNTGLRS